MQNLILIGMPGCGKSTVGVLAAKALGLPFLDTDLILQHRSGRLLQTLVDELGVPGFLRLEEETVCGVACAGTVVATGGSVALEARAMAHLKENGVALYLRLPCGEIERRLRNIATRGIAMGPGESLRALYDERAPYYERYADAVLDCAGQTLEETVSAAVAAYRRLAQ